MGGLLKDSTTLDILMQLNKRFEPEALSEMVELQREFEVFSGRHSLQQSFKLLGIVPNDWAERRRWYRFLDHLKTYPSDVTDMTGHDRVIHAFKENLESEKPLSVSIVCHAATDDPRVIVSQGRAVVFSLDMHVIISIPTTPGREARQQVANEVRARRARELAD
ncbi:MAG: hypothetical protein WA702_10505 [Bradyrhizobium sp.]|jgi:hypothetical protein|uniref:hypothetical protein n=1 Tax=Bradyrhizobium sp. TaxID=376 RepID=UPI003C7A0C81